MMSDARLALIRFVTARQADLQGLRNSAFALTVIAQMGVVLWLRPAIPIVGQLVVLGTWIVLSEASSRVVDRWYASRYGRVSSDSARSSVTASMLMGLGAMLDFTPWFPAAGYSGFVVVVALYGARVAFRDFPYRGYHLVLVALPGITPVVLPNAPFLGYFPAYAATLALLAAVGFLDHWLLRLSLARLKQQVEAGQHL